MAQNKGNKTTVVVLICVIILLVLALLGAVLFGVWAYFRQKPIQEEGQPVSVSSTVLHREESKTTSSQGAVSQGESLKTASSKGESSGVSSVVSSSSKPSISSTPKKEPGYTLGTTYYNKNTATAAQYTPSVIFHENGTYTLLENLYECMGTYTGKYALKGNQLVLSVEDVNFKGWLGDDVSQIVFTVKSKSSLVLQTQLCMSSPGQEFCLQTDAH